MRYRITATAAAALVTLLAGCAAGGAAGGSTSAPSGTPAQQAALARYLAYAGPPVDYFTWLGQFYSWEPLGKDTLVVFTVPDEAYLLNSGSIGQPRDGDPRAAYAVYDSASRHISFHRVRYDIAAVQAKIRRAGLPDALADRLAVGQ